ncbi:hypothetical protein F4809DRAFT_663499 [Biscogniauxia mediterranea]|nr:hypothetical protein F4809DRAFT_663499 [Biscogniauxia mediterranea]
MCNCERITYRCICRHKERKIQRCWSYPLKKSNLCLAAVMPVCKTHKRHVKLTRLCDVCDEYFATRYGDKDVVKAVAARFLAYKEAKGWGKKAIDPHTVPREVYVTAADLDALRQMYPHQPPPRSGYHHPGVPTRRPLQAGAGSGSSRGPSPAQVRAPPQVYRTQLREKAIPPRGHLPPPPPPAAAVVEYGTGEPIELGDLVGSDTEPDAALPELRHLAADQYRSPASSSSAFLQHPVPRVSLRGRGVSGQSQTPMTTSSSSGSDISVVRHLTDAARTWTYPNPESPRYPEVPRLAPAPRTAGWRGQRKHKQSKSSSSSSAGSRSSSTTTTTTTYHVRASPSGSGSGPSLARVLSPSHTHVVVPPPQRLEGVLVHAPLSTTLTHTARPPYTAPGGGGDCPNVLFYRERGVAPSPSLAAAARRGCRSAPPALLQVSVHAPPPSFSCAVQAQCFCGHGDKGKETERCPACAERETFRRQLKMDWI